MPICVPDELPSIKVLAAENIFVMPHGRSISQDIRPLNIAVLNLMPTKEVTDTQILRVLSNNPLQINITLLHTATYDSTHTNADYLGHFYRTFEEIRDQHFDGMIITGAPVEHLPFEEIAYWDELTRVMRWAKKHVFSTLYICWAAQAALYYHYGIPKRMLPEKMFGVFPHKVLDRTCKLVTGFDDVFNIPMSRHTAVDEEAVYSHEELKVVAASEESGIGLIVSRDRRSVFATGHGEYDPETLASEYFRDVNKGLEICVPKHYFPNDDPAQAPVSNWRSHANLLYQNWLNYYVYQETPYDLNTLEY